jgi:RimJ/RimL family protein N-acetyltransferase
MKTDRIGFSVWSPDDTALAVSLWGDPMVTRYISATGVFSLQDIDRRLKLELSNNKRYGVQYWPIFSLEDDTFLGCCGLRPYKLEEKIYELGFHLKSNVWGKGYATEAAKGVIRYAFDILKAESLFAGHHPGNESSRKLLEKLGFHFIRNEYYAPTGLCHPSYLLRQSQ